MSPDRYQRCIEESSRLYSAIKKEVDDGLADNRDGYVAFFLVRRARADGSAVAQGVLIASSIVFGIIERSRSPYRDPVDTSALILAVTVCVIVALATLSLLNNPILWALGTLAVISLGTLRMSD